MPEAMKLQGRYRLETRLAAGSMGAVYAATDERLQRRVAVKLLKDELAHDPTFVERFRREARAIAALSHPNIARVFDSGEDGGNHFIVMELAEGRDLGRLLRDEGAISSERAIKVAIQMCEALGHAHEIGLIHRDVKPGNVIVDEDDRAMVTDFGIARAAGDSTLTGVGAVLGTAHYLAPERAAGSPASPSSDLYSVGIVLYEMLTGTLPFQGDSLVEIVMQHVDKDVPPPSKLIPEVPPELDRVVADATEGNPEERFRTAPEMIGALEEACAAIPGATPRPAPTDVMERSEEHSSAAATVRSMPVVPRPSPSRRRGVLTAVSILLVVGAGALLFALFGDNLGEGDGSSRAGAPVRESREGNETSPDGSGATAPVATPSETPDEGGDEVGEASPSTTPAESPGAFAIKEEVIGEDADAVEEVLEGAGYEVKTDKVESEGVADSVVGTDPQPGVPLADGQTITLFVSKGP